ncbi:MAG: hypothetical protein JWQ09_2855 [Segetibacter sp.]|nr:hypothetical protein [Segetibacter sp.]
MHNTSSLAESNKPLPTKVLGYIGYQIGNVVIVLIWVVEKIVRLFNFRKKNFTQ